MIGSWLGLVCTTGNVTALSICSGPVTAGAVVAVARDRSCLLVWITSTVLPGTRSYHMTCSPPPSAAIQGWKRSFMIAVSRAGLMTCGVLQVLFPSLEKLRKMRVALLLPPPTPSGRSFHTAYRTPLGSTVVLGSSELRMSCPGAVSMTSRRSEGLLQATILSPSPFTAAMVVMRETVPVPAAAVAIIWCCAVIRALVHPAGTCCSHET